MRGKKSSVEKSRLRWMTQCDVIRYTLRMPDKLKAKLKKEAESRDMDMSSYICGILAGEIRRSQKGERSS